MKKHFFSVLLAIFLAISSWAQMKVPTGSFKSDCEPIVVSDDSPYTESFDNSSAIDCWTTSSDSYWEVNASNLLYHGYDDYGVEDEIISPVYDLSNLTNPYIKFDHRQIPYDGDYDKLTLYYRNSSDGDWVQLATYQYGNEVLTTDSLPLISPSATYQLRFLFTSYYADGVEVDNINIYNQTADMDGCTAPIAVSVSNITTNSADVSWYQSGNGSEWKVYYKKSSASSWEESMEAYTTSIYLDELSASTSYDLYVALICDGEELASNMITFTTVCSSITANGLPISTGFETEFPTCWTLVSGEADLYSYVPNTGSKHLLISTDSDEDFIMALPGYAGDITQLQLSFFGLPFLLYTESVSFTIQVGVLTDLEDTENFATVDSWSGSQISSDDYTEFTASFKDLFSLNPDLDEYAEVFYPAIRIINGSGDFLFVDDVTLQEIPTCSKATDLTATEVEGDKITVTWNQSDEESVASYNVYYRQQGSPAWSNPQTVTQNTATIENLIPSTTYEIYVETVCDEESNSSSNILIAKTACAAFDVPWSTSFETDVAYELPNCWTLLNGYITSYDDVYPYVFQSSYSSYSGQKVLYMYSSYTPNIIALPLFTTDVKNLQLTFQSRPTNITSAGSISVCVTNNIADTANLEYVWTKNCSEYASSEYVKEVVNFNNITTVGDDIYIVFVHQNGTYWYIDDVKVDILPDCEAATNVTVSNIAPTSAVITWKQEDEDIDAWKVYYKSSSEASWTSVDVTCSTVNAECDDSLHTTSYILENLTPDATYDIYVSSICGENSPSSDIIFFKTLCSTVVVTDENEYTEPFASESALSCWQLSSTSTYYTLGYNNGTLNMPSMSSAKASAITPLFDISAVTTPYLKYKYKLPVRTYLNNQYVDKFTIYYRTSVSESWNELKVYTEQQDVLVEDSLALPEASETYQLRFYFEGKSGGGFTIDDVTVYNEENPPSCVAAMQVTATEIDQNSATITWMQPDNSSYWNVYYKKSTDTEYEYTSVIQTSFTLSELEANTHYDVYVETDCGGDDNPVSDVISFKTDCDAITVTEENPYIEGFESYTADSLSSPDCWTKVREGKSSMRIQVSTTTNNISGSKVLSLRAGKANKVAVVALPEFTNDLNTLAVSFYLRSSSASNAGTLSFGYMTDLSDTSTFVALKSYPKTQNSWLLENLYMDDFTADLDGVNSAYFAFRHDNSEYAGSSYEQFYIDSVTVSLIPACKEISDLIVSDIDANSAKITWNGSSPTYKVKISNGNTVAYENDTCSVTEIEVNTLMPATSYTVSVQGVCSETTTSVVSKTFVTSCVALTEADLPKTWDFETDNTAGTASYPLPTCWKRTNGLYPYVNNNGTYANSGTRLLYFYYSGSPYTGVMTALDDEIDMTKVRLSLYARASNVADFYTTTLEVGVMTDPTDTSTFEQVASTGKLSDIYDLYEFSFEDYQGTGHYIAFRTHNNDWYVCVDDVTLSLDNPIICDTPTDLNVVDSTETSVTVSWNGTAAKYKVQRDEETAVEVEDTVYTFSNLTAGTSYNIKVQAVCENDVTSEWSELLVAQTVKLCDKPTSISTDAVTSTMIIISWNGEAASYDVQLNDEEIQNTSETAYTFDNLTPNTTYSIKLRSNCGQNVSDWVPLSVKTAKQQDEPNEPVVTTGNATATTTTAVLNATVVKGTSEVVASGFKYRKSGEDTWTNEVEAEIQASGLMSKEITDLEEETEYEFMAFVKTEDGKDYTGLVSKFKTQPSSLNDAENIFTVVTYPNPTTANATLSVKGLTTDARVIVTDINGRVISEEILRAGTETMEIKAENLASGVYYIRVMSDGISKTQQLIKK